MADTLMIGIRFLLFADLMLIVGLAAFPLYALRRLDGAAAGNGRVSCEATVIDIQYHGSSSRWQLRAPDGTVLAVMRPETGAASDGHPVGSRVRVSWPREHMVPLAETG